MGEKNAIFLSIRKKNYKKRDVHMHYIKTIWNNDGQ